MLSLLVPNLKYLSSSLHTVRHTAAFYMLFWPQWNVFRFSLWYPAADTEDCEYITN